MDSEILEKITKAGIVHQQLVAYAKEIVKKDVPLIDIANAIDAKIAELGAKPAFPINLSINEVAAHATPAFNDTTKAHGLLKVDIGVHIDGFVADGAFTLDLEGTEENTKLIAAAESGLAAAIDTIKEGVTLREIGAAVSSAIEEHGAVAVRNLSGHQIEQYHLHAGLMIPNYDNSQEHVVPHGLYAIEPFATMGNGIVKDGKPSGIFVINKEEGMVRDTFARQVLMFIDEEYQGLPFCSRWIHKEFGTRGLVALRQIAQAGIVREYEQLVEVSRKNVAQAEHTVLLKDDGTKLVTTRV